MATHKFSQFIVNDFHHQLSRLYTGQYILAESLLLHLVGEGFGHFIIDVGVEQGTTYILEGFGYIDLGDAAFTLKYLERPFKSFAKIFKHVGDILFILGAKLVQIERQAKIES